MSFSTLELYFLHCSRGVFLALFFALSLSRRLARRQAKKCCWLATRPNEDRPGCATQAAHCFAHKFSLWCAEGAQRCAGARRFDAMTQLLEHFSKGGGNALRRKRSVKQLFWEAAAVNRFDLVPYSCKRQARFNFSVARVFIDESVRSRRCFQQQQIKYYKKFLYSPMTWVPLSHSVGSSLAA